MSDAVQIHDAFVRGDLARLRALVGAAFPHGDVPAEFAPCLQYAIYHSPVDFVAALVDLGADPNYATDDGFPSVIAALSAARADRLQVVRLLLAKGADVHQRGINDWTPLHYAAAHGDLEAIEMLLAAGADPTARTRIDEATCPLDEAERQGHHDAARVLKTAASAVRS